MTKLNKTGKIANFAKSLNVDSLRNQVFRGGLVASRFYDLIMSFAHYTNTSYGICLRWAFGSPTPRGVWRGKERVQTIGIIMSGKNAALRIKNNPCFFKIGNGNDSRVPDIRQSNPERKAK